MNINVDEDELTDGHHRQRRDDHGGDVHGRADSGLVASGADEPVTVSLNAAIDNVDTGLDSQGAEHPV